MPLDWTVAPGYEPVRDAFVKGAGTFGRGGGAYCAYVGGVPVVDLWAGSARPGQPWEAGTTTVIMSATKGLTALCAQLLVDRGRLDVDAPVTAYWPEFGQAGKERTLVRDLLLHRAGVLGFPGQTDLLRFDGTGWDDAEAIASGFAAAAPEWPPGTRHGYHALSFGWLVGELVRRVSGRTVGAFFRGEVAEPLGLEVWLGTPDHELARVAHVLPPRTEHLPGFVRRGYASSLAVARDPSTLSGKAFLGGSGTSGIDQLEVLFNNPKVLRSEFPAGGATATARGLARLWATLGAGGELDGVRLLGRATVDSFAEVVQDEPDLLMAEVPIPRMLAGRQAGVPRTLGYLGNTPMTGLGWRFGPDPQAYGVEGLGGQFAFCDPHGEVAVGYVRSECAVVDVLQPELTTLLYACARRLGHDVRALPRRGPLRAGVDRAAGAYLRRALAVPAG